MPPNILYKGGVIMIKALKSNSKIYCSFAVIFSLSLFSLLYVLLIILNNDYCYPVMNNVEEYDYNGYTVIIDPGHGGIDGGAVSSNGIVEKDINLRISKYIKNYCDLSGVNCILTRSDDTLLKPNYSGSMHFKRADLLARTEIASNYEKAVFVSIHQNKFESSKYSGLQVFYSKNNPQSIILARILRESNKEMISPENNREIKPAGREIYILDNIEIPSVLVECGFLSNQYEADRLNNDMYQRELAFMIYSSIMKYIYDSNLDQ